MLCHFATVSSRITRFLPNAHTLPSNTKNGQILNIVSKYSLFGSWSGNYSKSINTADIFKVVTTEEKFAKSKHFKINGKHFHPKN